MIFIPQCHVIYMVCIFWSFNFEKNKRCTCGGELDVGILSEYLKTVIEIIIQHEE